MRIKSVLRRPALAGGLFTLTLGLVRAAAADYFVSTQGNDANPGTASQPFRTITRAYSLASAGTTITVLPGVYTDYQSGWGLHLNKNGTAASPITLRSQVRGQAIIDGQNVSDRNQGIYLDGSYNIIDGFQIRGGPHGGISVWGNDNQILNNEIHRNGNPASTSTFGQDGVYSSETTRNTVYRGNYIHDNGRTGSNLDHALYLCGDNEVVINNVLVRNAAYGLHIAGYTTVSNMKVYNNVMAHNAKSGIILWMAVSGVDIKNNIIFQNGRFGLDSWDAHGSGVVLDRNLVFGNASGNYNFINGASDYTYTLGTTISSAPLFVNSTAAGFDAHLSAGSPAINAGLNLSSSFTTDLDGTVRPASGAWDLGAYKYGVTDTTPPTVSITAPASGATISGLSVTVSANASDNVGVTGVQFKLNGANLGAEDTSAPYSVTLNTTTLLNSAHTLTAVARDAAGNQTTASAVSVQVNNLVNTAPTISSIANQTIPAGSATGPLAFTVGDLETAAGSLTVSGSSSNPTLVPSSGIVFGGSGASRTVTVTPAAGQTGTATLTVTVSDGSLTKSTSFGLTVNALPAPTVTLTAPANGASYTAPATINLAASVTPNGNTISKVQFYQGSTLLGEDTSAPYTYTWSSVSAGSYNLSTRAVYGTGSTVASPTVNVSVAAAPSSGLTFASTSGAITAPFVAGNGVIYQTAYTATPAAGGRAAYSFTITNPGNYTVSVLVNAPDDGANSFFVNIDAEPADPVMTWDVPITSGLTARTVAWRGNGTVDSAQYAPKVFTLAAGTHTLIVRGREANCQLGTITLVPAANTLPVVALTAPANGASYTAPATINLAASVTANGNTISKVQFYQGTTLLGEDTTAPYTFAWNNVSGGSYSLSARAVYGAGSVVASPAVSVGVTSAPPVSQTFAATSGTLMSPFVAANGTVSQPAYTSLAASGRAAYNFTISTAGNYDIAAQVNAPDDSANSFFVNIDAEPADPVMTWDIPLTSGLTERTVSWRGNGTFDNAQFAPKVFTLSAGAHQLIVRGREGNTQLGNITIRPVP
jgi:hypothetical protein